jgi:hypothetical protein
LIEKKELKSSDVCYFVFKLLNLCCFKLCIMAFGKTIKIFLIDGDPNGRMTCELSNWTGKAYKIPRIKIKDCVDRDDLQNTGVYLLFGKNDENKDLVYIGEAEVVLKRINQHLLQKEFWTEVLVFISKDENLNKAHIKYLENRMFELAKNADRYKLENTVIPTQSSISESDTSEMEEFLENIKMLTNTLGHKVFDEKRDFNSRFKDIVFTVKGTRGAFAHGAPSSEGFVVFKGSSAAKITVPSFRNFNAVRDRLIQDGTFQENEEVYTVAEDIIFNSPSAASSVILGRNSNGMTEWKLADGKTLKEYESGLNSGEANHESEM